MVEVSLRTGGSTLASRFRVATVCLRIPRLGGGGSGGGIDVSDAGLRPAKRGLRALSLPVWILLGAVAGILAGVALGERTSVLQPIGDAYGRMLQMAVYPYLICSLLGSLGRLTPKMAWRLLGSSWHVYLFVWVATLATIWLLAQVIPAPPLPSVLTQAAVHQQTDFLTLLIPANLIDALGQNYVPAVVVFAIFYGVAIQRVESKDALFQVLQVVQTASVTIWTWIVCAAPLGVFALMASAAGSIQPDRLGGVLLYVGLFLIGTIFLSFVVLPMALGALVPFGYREIMKELQPALVLALVTTLSVVALPFIAKATERLTAKAGCPETDECLDIRQANLSLSYVLAQLGNYFIYLLILYGAFAYRVRPSASERLLLPFWTLMSAVGAPTGVVNGVTFLSGWLGLPDDALYLFLETWPITRYGQVGLSVVGMGFVNILIPLIYFGKLKPRPMRALLAGTVSVGLLAILVLGGMSLGPRLLPAAGNPKLAFTLESRLTEGVTAEVRRGPTGGASAAAPRGELTLSAIQSSGVLRVGYNPDVIPFSYWNDRGDLVGFDISYAYELARDLNVKLEFLPFDWRDLSRDLVQGRFDIAMSGIYVTDDRLQTLTVSDSYYQSPMALVVHAERASEFLDRAAINAMPNLRLVVFDDPELVPMVHYQFPRANVRVVENYGDLPAMADQFDAAVWTLQQASAWTAAHPGFTAVRPAALGTPFLFAYLLPPGADSFRQFLNQWLALHAANGFRAAQLDYWIKGKPRAGERRPRWNLFDVLMSEAAR